MTSFNERGGNLFLNPLPPLYSTPPDFIISLISAERSGKKFLSEEEIFSLVDEKDGFERWMMMVYNRNPGEYMILDPKLEIYLPVLETVSDPDGNLYIREGYFNFSFLYAIWNFAELSLRRYHELLGDLKQGKADKKAIIIASTVVKEYCEGFLPRVRQVAERRVDWVEAGWEEIKGGWHIYKKCAYFGKESQFTIYFTPGRHRFGIRVIRPNPFRYNPRERGSICFSGTEARFDIDRTDTEKFCLVADFSVRRWKGGEEEELVDGMFGEKRHHLPVIEGKKEFCEKLISDFMGFLNLGDMIKSTRDIPQAKIKKR